MMGFLFERVKNIVWKRSCTFIFFFLQYLQKYFSSGGLNTMDTLPQVYVSLLVIGCCFCFFVFLTLLSFENTVGKGEIAHNEQFLNFLPFSSNLRLSSANSFSLLFRKGLKNENVHCLIHALQKECLTLGQTTNFGQVQIDGICR